MRTWLALWIALSIVGCVQNTPSPPSARGTWSFIVLPDTQYYAAQYPEIFHAQTRWIVDHKREYDIRGVIHLGDITDNNSDAQWEVASVALHRLDGVVPYLLVPGNHDYGVGGSANDRSTQLNRRFPFAAYSASSSFLESFEDGKIDSHAQIFETPIGPWLVVGLEFGPRDPVVTWAQRVLGENRTMPAIVVTHAHTYYDDTRYDRMSRPDQQWSPYVYGVATLPGGVNDGQELFDALVRGNDHVRFVLSGHVLADGLGVVATTRPSGARAFEILQNYQMNRLGGEGYLRIYEFSMDGTEVHVQSYSPYLNAYKTDAQNDFRLRLSGP